MGPTNLVFHTLPFLLVFTAQVYMFSSITMQTHMYLWQVYEFAGDRTELLAPITPAFLPWLVQFKLSPKALQCHSFFQASQSCA